MKNNLLGRVSQIGCAALLTAVYALAQEHKWAGRTLNDLEWTIHEELAVLPHGVFETLDFQVQGKAVTLSGKVINERVKRNAERVVGRINSVESVANQIEVLPSSRRDDALRVRMYRSIYQARPLEKYGMRAAPPIQIIVKDGWVTLEGVVDSDADRSMVHLQALKVTAHVSDNLRVAPEE